MNLWLLSFLPILIYGSIQSAEDFLCPKQCDCIENTRKVDCSRRSLSHIPENIPKNVKILDLRYNLIKRLTRSDLRGFDKLETLLLGNNLLAHLNEVRLYC